MVVDVSLEYTELGLRRATPDVNIGTERVQVRSLNWPVCYVDLSILESCEHGGEV
jgi:hypothetical protein